MSLLSWHPCSTSPLPISHQHKLPIFIFKPAWDPTYHLSLSGGRNTEQSSSSNCPAWADFQFCCAWSSYAFLEQDVTEEDWSGAKKGVPVKGSQKCGQLQHLNVVKTWKWTVSFGSVTTSCASLKVSPFSFSSLWCLSYLENTLHKHPQIYVGSSLQSP